MATGRTHTLEETLTAAGATRTYLATKGVFRDPQGTVIGLIGISRDVTEMKRLEEQFRQAQKMEAIGRLAGGVAHDFNNLLTAIIGYTEVVVERAGLDDRTRRDVSAIRKAADRAAALTRQLLAFSRKQVLTPTILDLNETASGLLQMLPRVIGDHIKTRVLLASDLARVKADASQMEQVLVNLVLNARDAMTTGGHLTIETANVLLTDARLRAENLTVRPGQYVMLTVTDTGTGMDAATRARVFEPFFTTKPKGKGTGLGLATVYGIVEQSGGGIALDTALGRGTSFRIYLPATRASADRGRSEPPPIRDATGTETVLLVEFSDSVRDLSAQALRRRGYTVHEARDADEALEWTIRTGVKPHLLVTDVMIPGLSGPKLASRLLQVNPRLRVLYLSGYTDDTTEVGSEELGGALLQKPFTPAALAERVRLALDASSQT
jgi:signal transduction histidine kinase